MLWCLIPLFNSFDYAPSNSNRPTMAILLRFLDHFTSAVLNSNWNIAHVQSISVDLLQLNQLDPLGKTIL